MDSPGGVSGWLKPVTHGGSLQLPANLGLFFLRIQADFCDMVNLGSLGVLLLLMGWIPSTRAAAWSLHQLHACLEKWGVMASTMVWVCTSPRARSKEQPLWGMEQWRGWMETVGRDVVVWQGGGMVSLSKVGVLDPKDLGQGRGHSRRTAQVA